MCARARVCICLYVCECVYVSVCVCVSVCSVRACMVRARKVPAAVEGREREREKKVEEGPSRKKSLCVHVKNFQRPCLFFPPFFLFLFYNHGDSDDDADNNDDDDVERKSCDSTSSFGFISLSRHIASSPFSKAKGTAYGCFRKWVDTRRSVSIEGRSREMRSRSPLRPWPWHGLCTSCSDLYCTRCALETENTEMSFPGIVCVFRIAREECSVALRST